MTQISSYAPLFQNAIEYGIDFKRLRQNLEAGVKLLFQHPKFRLDASIYMTGSGDSLFAAQCVMPGLQRWAGLNATVLTAIEFSRYRVTLLTEVDALWAISNSGSAARTRETVSMAKSRGILAIGVTGSESGPLAASADTYLFRPVEDLPQIPEKNRGIFMNMNEFMVTLYSLYYLGLAIGVANGRLQRVEADAILTRCESSIRSIGALATKLEPMAIETAAQLEKLDTIWTIGAGPNFGTARYCAAKFHEQLPWNGIPEDLEEWAHLQYFLTLTWKTRSAVFVLAPPGNSLDRAEELVEGIAGAGGRAYVVAHPDFGEFESAQQTFRISGEASEFLAPFTYHLPEQLLIMHLSGQMGQDPYALRRADDYRLIRHGSVRSNASDLV